MPGKRGRPRKDHGTTFAKRGVWHFKLGQLLPSGEKVWKTESSGIVVGDSDAERKQNYKRAELKRRQRQNAINAGLEFGSSSGDVTLTTARGVGASRNERNSASLRGRTSVNA